MNRNKIYVDGTYLGKNPTWHEEDSPWKAKQIAKILKKNDLFPARICEIGCGAGKVLSSLAEIYDDHVEFDGYEVSPQAYEICKKKEKPNIRFFLKDILEEDLDEKYDLVLAIDVFEHIEDYFGFLRRLKGKGRYTVFHIPLNISVQTVLRSWPLMSVRESVGHIHYFMKETALATLQDTGFEIIDYLYTPKSLEFPNLGWKGNLMKLPRKVFFSLNQDLAVRIFGGFSLLVLAE